MAIASALDQTYSNLEVVVSNNASDDDTATVLAAIADPRVRLIQQPSTVSMIENWNACVKAATGDYFLMLSDDDLLDPEAVQALVAEFELASWPEKVGFAYCRGRMIDHNGDLIGMGKKSPPIEGALSLILSFFNSERHTWPCSILFRTSDMSSGYSSNFIVIADAAMWVNAVVRYGEAHFVDRPLVSYRVHQNATARTPIAVWQRENSALAAFAIAALEHNGRSNATLVQSIRIASSKLNARIIPGLLNGAYRQRRLAGIGQYLRYLPCFVATRQLRFWLKAFLFFVVPASIRRQLRRMRTATPA
jgi:glycosyltransferase involved in cell wall biosynthesis